MSEAWLEGFVARHGCMILRVARRFSQSFADAEDAYQRGLELLLTKAPAAEDERLASWLATVVRNEALMTVRRGKHTAGTDFEAIVGQLDTGELAPDEWLVESERVDHGREALSRLTPDQARCLLLRADGLSYAEIGEMTGFSYAKTHRCLAEGRKRFVSHVTAIDQGHECERMRPLLSLMADGEASGSDRLAVRNHLRSCLACRAEMRQYRSAPSRLAALFPVGVAIPADRGLLERVADGLGSVFTSLQERALPYAASGSHGAELGLAKKAVAVTAAAATLVAGGTAATRLAGSHDRPARSPATSAEPLPQSGADVTGASGEPAPAGEPKDQRSTEKMARDATREDVEGKPVSGAADRPESDAGSRLLDDDSSAEASPAIDNDDSGVSPDQAAEGGLAP